VTALAWPPLLLLAAHPTVTSDSSCPSARDIASNLAVLLPDDTAQSGTAAVSPTEDGLVVDLRPENPAFTAQRTVVVGTSCEERAKAAAVVIATWWPVGSAGPGRAESAAAGAVPEEGARRWEAAAGGYASMVSGSVAAGARVEASFAPRGRAFGVRLAAGGTAAHEDDLAHGQVRWSRASVELGGTYAHRFLRVDAGAVGSLLQLAGSGFTENRRTSGAAVGFTVGVRAVAPWGRVQPWLELRGIAWPQSQEMTVTDSATGARSSQPLPHAELQLGAGVAFALF
jgi:hypothetical protein